MDGEASPIVKRTELEGGVYTNKTCFLILLSEWSMNPSIPELGNPLIIFFKMSAP